MKNLLALVVIAFAIRVTAMAENTSPSGEWALVVPIGVSSGTVTSVIVATYQTIQEREDGPWFKTAPQKVGTGWTYNYMTLTFSPPVTSTFTVVTSTP